MTVNDSQWQCAMTVSPWATLAGREPRRVRHPVDDAHAGVATRAGVVHRAVGGCLDLATGDMVISTENDSNDIKITV